MPGATVRLLYDTVFSDGSEQGTYRNLELYGENITFDLNGKTLKTENENSEINVFGTYTIKNGTLDAQVRFTSYQETGHLTVENVESLKLFLAARKRTLIKSGKFTYLRTADCNFTDILDEGKAYYF